MIFLPYLKKHVLLQFQVPKLELNTVMKIAERKDLRLTLKVNDFKDNFQTLDHNITKFKTKKDIMDDSL